MHDINLALYSNVNFSHINLDKSKLIMYFETIFLSFHIAIQRMYFRYKIEIRILNMESNVVALGLKTSLVHEKDATFNFIKTAIDCW